MGANIMYFHGGSGNHGCEALFKTLKELCSLNDIELYSYRPEEDAHLGCNVRKTNLNTDELDTSYPVDTIAISMGGDNYCYRGAVKPLEKYNIEFHNKGVKTALIGCSITPELIPTIIDDLQRYDLITAREGITYKTLKDNDINCKLIPDSAFILETKEVDFDDRGKEWIGINASSLTKSSMTIENYKVLIDYILKDTNFNIMLIPHVVQSHNDDLESLQNLYINKERMVMVKGDCNELKGYISKCKMVVTARTHVSIASYSLCVPTLVLGYSVKSLGIATDLFGTTENYVKPMDELKDSGELKKGFIWIIENYDGIKKHLEEIMPEYKNRCYELRDVYEMLCSKK